MYGEAWREKWEEISCHILMGNGINSQGNFPGIAVNNGHGKLAYVRELPGFPMTDTLIFRDFPDVLSPEYQQKAERYAQKLEEWRDDHLVLILYPEEGHGCGSGRFVGAWHENWCGGEQRRGKMAVPRSLLWRTGSCIVTGMRRLHGLCPGRL